MADLDTAKLHWNSVIGTALAKYMCLDIKNFYLTAALEYFEYIKIPLTLFPEWTIKQYNLCKHALNRFIHLEMRQAVWGLLQSGILANKHLCCKLEPFRYFESTHTLGLWRHETRPILFTLVADNFGVKYVNKDNFDHLITSIRKDYSFIEDWMGDSYCGIQLDWNYLNRTVDISMPGYIGKKLQEYGHIMPNKVQTCPYPPEPKNFGTKAQAPLPPDTSPKLDAKGIKSIQKIVGSILHYACTINMMMVNALSLAVEQTKATEQTMVRCTQLLDYLSHNANVKNWFCASDMVLNIHANASYLLEPKAWSYVCGHFFMGWTPQNGKPIHLNGVFHVSSTILHFFVVSVAEAELGVLYHNCQTGIIFRLTLKKMEH